MFCFMIIFSTVITGYHEGMAYNTNSTPCSTAFTIPGVKLKDHTLFSHQDFYYLAAIRIELSATEVHGPGYEDTFAYARTLDFCTWENLGTVLNIGLPGDADETAIWAPHVIQEGETFYMFYTGVNRHIAQSIMLATSHDPSDLQSWVKHGVVFRPHHEGMVYPGPDNWADARDPMVFRYDDRYYMYYTGLDTSGGIIGVAMADSLTGPWVDLGATLHTGAVIPESPFVVTYQNYFYLFYHATFPGESRAVWRWAPSPFGPWQSIHPLQTGWAHDFYLSVDTWYMSYLVGNGEAIKVVPLDWDHSTSPPRPQIDHHTFLPIIVNSFTN